VLYVGRVSEEKGVDVLLDAWAAARPSSLDLVVVGDGPTRAKLESRRIPGVRFTGWLAQSDVRDRLLSSRTLMFPSMCYEVLPATIIEAMAAGLPVVGSDHGGSAEIVSGLGPGWLAEPGSREAWVDALSRVLDDDAVDRAGERARYLYDTHYSSTVGLAPLLEVYRGAIHHPTGAPRPAVGPVR
jgi:glycosyltransferase involved in cell wall biosynthesis